MLNILITAPSLNEHENVSGISTMVRTIIENNAGPNNFIHFKVGKKDGERKGLKWIADQFLIVPRLISAIKKKKIDLVYLNTDLTKPSILRDYTLFKAARVMGKKILLHIHGGHFLMTPPEQNSVFFRMIRTMLSGAGTVIVLSEIERNSIQKNYGVNSVALPNAIEIPKREKESKNFENKLQIIFLGRVVKSKGIHIIINSLSNLNQFFNRFDFHIYGSGPELDIVLEKLGTVKGLSYSYHGVVRGSDKWKAFDQAHVFLLPSLFGEGLPIAMLEAMGRGCIPVVSDDASISSVVSDNVNGYIVRKGDEGHLASVIQNLLQNRTNLPEMSLSAQTTIRNSYDIGSYLARLNNYCSSV